MMRDVPRDPDVLDPATVGVVVFDMLECYRDKIEASGAIEPVRRLLAACRGYGIPTFYARADHREDGADANRTLTDVTPEFEPWDGPQSFLHPHGREGYAVLSELAPIDSDYDVPKHRWNALFQTHLDLSLRSRGIDTILLVGGSTHVGIASTAFAARDLDYQVIVVKDGLTGYEPQRTFFAEQVFPRMCRVRTVDQSIAMLSAGVG
jgi:nicotinamidase-related amidase